MSLTSKDRKISDFVAQSSLPSDAELIYISNGQNYRISIADLIASLGVTGTIQQAGDPTGTPILNTAGAVNNIRNIEDGSGIRSSVSAQNGVTLEHNFTEDLTGVKLVQDLTADQPKLRSLVAGSGISISGSNGQIQIAQSAIPVTTKTVIVNQISDFPAAVGGVITLADNTEYAIRNDITTSNRFVLGQNCVISGSDNEVVNIVYTGANTMFTAASDKDFTIKDITLTCSSGTFINATGVGLFIMQLKDCVINANILGTIGGFTGIHFDSNQINATTDGFTFTGSNGVILIEAALVNIAAGVFYDLGAATFDAFSVLNGFYNINGSSTFLKGAAASANINANRLGSVVNCRFFIPGAGTILDTITTSDLRWAFKLNDRIEDSTRDCLMSLVANATNTVIAVAGTPVKVAGAWTEEHKDKFTTDATGKMVYVGEVDNEIDITMSFSVAPVSGTNKLIELYAAVNGAVISNSIASAVVSSSNRQRITVVWRQTLTKNDYIEAFVANATDTVDVLVTDAVMRLT